MTIVPSFIVLRRSSTRLTLAAIVLVVSTACAPRQPLEISEVVNLGRAGAPPEQVIRTVRASQTTYALEGSDYCRLREAGVPDPVLDHLQQAFVDHVDFLTRYWVLGESLGNCPRCYPQQVDLSGVASGASPSQTPPRIGYYVDRPSGMPDWYLPYNSAARRGAVAPADIRRMATSGASEDELLRTVRGSRLEGVIASGGLGRIGTHLKAGLEGSELGSMCAEGVPEPVVDALQSAFLSQYVELQRLRYQNLGKGPGGSFP